MNRRWVVVLICAVAVVGSAALFSFRVAAAPSGTRVMLPVVGRNWQAAPARLPDLIITSVFINMRGYDGGCVPQYAPLVIVACARNQGQGDAGPFSVAVNGIDAATSSGLPAGENACLETDASYTASPVTAVVDPGNQVVESDESNNAWTGPLPVPTPPPLCTVTPTPSPTACPPSGAGAAPDLIAGCPLRTSETH